MMELEPIRQLTEVIDMKEAIVSCAGIVMLGAMGMVALIVDGEVGYTIALGAAGALGYLVKSVRVRGGTTDAKEV